MDRLKEQRVTMTTFTVHEGYSEYSLAAYSMEKESGLEVAKFLAQCISCCTKEQICLQGGGMKNRQHDENCHKSSASELKAIRSIRLKNGSSQGTQRTMATFTILSSLKKATQSSISLAV
jgi:hypothetical protein